MEISKKERKKFGTTISKQHKPKKTKKQQANVSNVSNVNQDLDQNQQNVFSDKQANFNPYGVDNLSPNK